MSAPVLEGHLLWKKKKGPEKRYFVLYTDRLEYFLEPEDKAAGQEPRGRLALQDVQSFTVTDDGFRIRLQGKDQDFSTAEDLTPKRWIEEMQRHLPPEAAAPEVVEPPGGEETSFATSPVTLDHSQASVSAVSPTRAFSPDAQAASEEWPTPASTSAASPAAPVGPPQTATEPDARHADPEPASSKGVTKAKTSPALVQQMSTPPSASSSRAQTPDPRAKSPVPEAKQAAMLCCGHLSVERKNVLVQRYFVLMEDRLHYYEDQKSADNGQEPRGFIDLSDIFAFEEREKGFVLQSRSEKKPLEFHAVSGEELAPWIAAWATAIKTRLGDAFVTHKKQQAEGQAGSPAPDGDVVYQGSLELVKEKKSEKRHFVLLANRFEYYSNAEDFSAGSKPRGQVALSDVRSVEVADEGMLLVELADRTIRLRAASPEVTKTWGESWDKVFHQFKDPKLKVVWKQAPDPSPAAPTPTRTSAAADGRISEPKPPEAPSASMLVPPEVAPEGPQPLWQGRFDFEDLMHPEGEPALVAIFQDRLEYWLRPDSVADKTASQAERRILVREIADLEVLDSGFKVSLHDGTVFGLRAKDDAAVNHCVEVIGKILSEEEVSTATTVTPGSSYSGNSSPISCMAQEGLGGAAQDPKRKLQKAPTKSALRSSAQPTEAKQNLPSQTRQRESIVHEGPLLVQRQSPQLSQGGMRPEVLHVVVYKDRFQYYSDKASMSNGAPPQGQVKLANVQQVRVQDAGFVLGLGNEGLNLKIPAGQDMQTWVNALWHVFDPDRLAQGADAGAGTAATPSQTSLKQKLAPAEEESEVVPRKIASLWSKTDRLPEKPLSTAELIQEAADPRVTAWLAALKERPCHSGVLGFQSRGKMLMRYAVMFQDRIDTWDSALVAAAGRRPSDRLLLRSVRGVEAVFGGFILNCGGKRVGIHVNSNDELRSWSTALLSVITAGLGTASASRSRSGCSFLQDSQQDDLPAQPKTPRAHSAGWVPRVATLASKPESTSPGRKTHFTHRSEGKCFTINTHKGSAEAGRNLHGQYAKVLQHAGRPGGRHLTVNIANKVNECEKTPRIPRIVAAENLTHKVTGTSPVCSPRKEPGSLTWLKVQHAEATPPPNTARCPMEPRGPPGPPYAVVPGASPSSLATGSSPKLRRTNSAPVTGKVNEVKWRSDGVSRRPPIAGHCQPMSKITDAGREQRTGWAQPDRPASVDKARGVADKRLAGMTPR